MATEETEETSVVMMASSICSLVLELTSEEFLLSEGYVSKSSLHSLSSLIATSLGPSVQVSLYLTIFIPIDLYVNITLFVSC